MTYDEKKAVLDSFHALIERSMIEECFNSVLGYYLQDSERSKVAAVWVSEREQGKCAVNVTFLYKGIRIYTRFLFKDYKCFFVEMKCDGIELYDSYFYEDF